MEGIMEAFNIVLGADFVAEMLARLLLIFGILAAVIALLIAIFVWKAVAAGKIKKTILALSEFPDDAHADEFQKKISRISGVGRFLAKHGIGFAGLSKSDCRVIFNSTVLPSTKMTDGKKTAVRACLMQLGCTGLTDVSVIS